MRVTLLRAGLVASLFTLAACGGGAEKPAATTTTTAAMKQTGTTAPAAQEEEYELDVIAEADRLGVALDAMPTEEACRVISKLDTYVVHAVLHVTC